MEWKFMGQVSPSAGDCTVPSAASSGTVTPTKSPLRSEDSDTSPEALGKAKVFKGKLY